MASSQDVLATADRHFNLGQLAEAEAAYYEVLQDPALAARAQYGLGLIYQQTGNAIHACEMFENALPHLDGAYRTTALARYAQVLEALGENPKAALNYYNAGALLFNEAQYAQAAAAFQCSLTLAPNVADAHQLLIVSLEQVAQDLEASAIAARVAVIKEQLRREIIARAPIARIAELWAALPSVQHCTEVLPLIWNDIAHVLVRGDQDQRYFFDLFEVLHRRLEIGTFPFYWEWAAYSSVHKDNPDFERYREIVLSWSDTMHIIHGEKQRFQFSPFAKDRALRVGVLDVSGVFGMVQYFKTAFEPALRALHAAGIDLFIYALEGPDLASDVSALAVSAKRLDASPETARVIAADDLDILLLPNGFLTANPVSILSVRPARRLVMWHHTHTTFGPWLLDAVIADRIIFNDYHRSITFETPVQIDRHPMLFGPPFQAPPVAPAPRHRNGHITFVVANRPSKVHVALMRLWGRILERVPTARLMFVGVLFSQPRQRSLIDQLIDEVGLPRSRLEFAEPKASQDDHLSHYAAADISLDTFPFNGGMITFEALWQGVPVVSRYDEAPLTRTGLAFLSPVGLGDLVADSDDAYVDLAVALANDGDRLDRLRASLREDLLQSSLMNPVGYADAMIDAFRRVLALPDR